MLDLSRVPESAPPKLSVCMVTYNHERFVAQAIESALMQETSFAFEIVIGEDCSTDRTREIVLDLEKRHPDQIRVSNHPENLGARQNWLSTLAACRADYIAWLDGDDYWTDKSKLQKQMDFLEAHPELVMCFHAVTVEDELNGQEFVIRPQGRRRKYGLEDLTRSSLIPTSAAVFRNRLPEKFPEWFLRVHYGDWSLWALLLEHGDIGYVDEIMSVQRRHAGGIMANNRSDSVRLCKVAMRMQRALIEHFGPERNRAFVDALYSSYYWLAHAYADSGRRKRARACLRRCLRDRGYDRSVSATEPFKALCHLYLPWLYQLIR